jgi:adenosylcobinamide-GDP ribazoletransferase
MRRFLPLFGCAAIVAEHRRGPKRKFAPALAGFGYRRRMTSPDDPLGHPPGWFAGFTVAAAFFTRIPFATPACGMVRLADGAWAFPLVGAGIGAVAACAFLLAQLVGLGDWPAALLAVLAGLAVTGALHEDGLADTADGLIGGHDRAQRLAIMRDSRHGTFGVTAIALSLLLRAAALAAIGEAVHAGLALIAAHAAARAMLPPAMRGLAPARAEGLGAVAGRPPVLSAVAALAIGLLISLAALGPLRGAIAFALAGAAVAAAGALAYRRIGGYTGDVLGAFQQIGEIVMLLTAAAA